MNDSITGKLILKPGREKPVKNRHPWLFSGAIQRVEGKPEPGDLVVVVDGNGRYLATAYYNPHSQIQARILTWTDEAIDNAFWQTKIQQAITGRGILNLEPFLLILYPQQRVELPWKCLTNKPF